MTDTASPFDSPGQKGGSTTVEVNVAEADDLVGFSVMAQDFLGALQAVGGSAGNGKLQDLFEWDDGAYEAVKAELVQAGKVVPGRGRGGSVSLAGS